jgi:cysteinyl-tRNA synthetase
MSLWIYNTRSGQKEEFQPLKPGKVGMYVCGVTVYDDCHLGHARGAVTFDIIRRYLEYKGYEVTYVRNFTDVDDKIIERANRDSINWDALAEKYIKAYRRDMGQLGVRDANIEPCATDHIEDMIQLISGLMEKGIAYESGGDIFYSVNKFEGYGKLSKRTLEDMQAGARVEIDERKQNPMDFVLWKESKPGEPVWDTPWGKGRPGWHIECSAMAMHFLGNSIDIHGGGKDLIFPHHENEIAQSEGYSGQSFAEYWMHNGFVNVDQEKMSKSLGNFFTIKDILAKFPPDTVRFFLLSTHYRSPIDFSDERLREAQSALSRFYDFFRFLKRFRQDPQAFSTEKSIKDPRELTAIVSRGRESFEKNMDDDFNTAGAIGSLFQMVRDINSTIPEIQPGPALLTTLDEVGREIRALGEVLGILEEKEAEEISGELVGALKELIQTVKKAPPESEGFEPMMEEIIQIRQNARKNKDWATADSIRNGLANINIQLEDYPGGTGWKLLS